MDRVRATGAPAGVPLGRVVWMVGLAVLVSITALAVLETLYLDLGVAREQLSTVRAEAQRLQQQGRRLTDQLDAAQAATATAENDADRQRERLAQANARLRAAEQEVAALGDRLTENESSLREARAGDDELREQLRAAQEDRQRLVAELGQRDTLRDDLLAANQALNEGLRRTAPAKPAAPLAPATPPVATLPPELARLRARLADAAQVLDLVWTRLSESREQLISTETEVQRLHILLEQSESANQQARARAQAEKDALEARLRAELASESGSRPAAAKITVADQAMEALRRTFGDREQEGRFELRYDEQGNTVIHLGNELLFGPGQAFVKSEGQDLLRELATTLARYPQRQLRVQGHTDSLPLTKTMKTRYASNWELASARANATIRYLQYALGIDPERIVSVAYGPYHPLAENRTPAGRARNRRIEIVLVRESPPSVNTAVAHSE